jgi:hypothetical protein
MRYTKPNVDSHRLVGQLQLKPISYICICPSDIPCKCDDV